MELREDGSPVNPEMRPYRHPHLAKPPFKVRDSKWADRPKPWTEWPIRANKMHFSSEVQYLYETARATAPGHYVNLGVGKGISIAALAYGIRDSRKGGWVHGVDLFNHIPKMTKKKLRNLCKLTGLKNVSFYEGYTHEVVSKFKGYNLNFVFIDADHHYETCKADFELWSPMVVKGGIVAFHDVDMETVDRVIREIDTSKWEQVEHVARIKAFKKL